MTIAIICIVIFILILGSGYAGLIAQKRLAEDHKTPDSRGVIGQVAGLVSLLLALVLGTLIGVSFSFFSSQKTQLETFSAQVLRLDQALKQYGPETKPARDKLKEAIVIGYETFWGGGKPDRNALTVQWPLEDSQRMADYLATLQPKTDAQKQALATANQYASMVEQTRLLTSLQVASHPVSAVLVVILVFWTVAAFFAIGLYATPNCVDWDHGVFEPLYGRYRANMADWFEALGTTIGVIHIQQTDCQLDRHWDFTELGCVDPKAAATLQRANGLEAVPVLLEAFYPFEARRRFGPRRDEAIDDAAEDRLPVRSARERRRQPARQHSRRRPPGLREPIGDPQQNEADGRRVAAAESTFSAP